MFFRFTSGPLKSSDFISIVILSYKRYDMTKQLVESIHAHADMPFELIIHDDASDGGVPKQLFEELRSKVSTLVVSGGNMNMGLAASFERGTSLATSDYVLLLNNDAMMTGPGFRDIVSVLQAPYVGVLGPWQVASGVSPNLVCVESNGCRFHLNPLCGSGSMMAFRREVWREVGGFPHADCGSSDTSFMRKVFKAGYWNAMQLVRDHECFDNADFPACPRSTIGSNKHDLSYPWLFKVPDLATKSKQYYNQQSRVVHGPWQNDAGGIANNDWWHNYYADAVVVGENRFDWDKLPYHQKWRDKVEEERVKL